VPVVAAERQEASMLTDRIERVLEKGLDSQLQLNAPPRLAAAIRHAVFPGGARVRPHLCLAVALACGDDDSRLADAYAAALELLHCASLVHDDLPCFDNAATRRGVPTVHAAFGERLAVLSGDALIVMAFRMIATARAHEPYRMAPLLDALSAAVGPPHGIVAGQAWECESKADLTRYQREKTGALFTAATVGGAIAAGADPRAWQRLGDAIGEAYQVADDIRDVLLDVTELGKPAGQDLTHDRPSSARELGLEGAVAYFDGLIAEAVASIPACRGATKLRELVLAQARRLLPDEHCAGLRRHPLGA
jgi:geranylgeranyl diphosphate synthase, type II